MTQIRHSPCAPRPARHERRAVEEAEAELAREFWDLLPPDEVHEAVVAAHGNLSWVRRRAYVPRFAELAARADLEARRRVPPRGPVNARALAPVIRPPRAGRRAGTRPRA